MKCTANPTIWDGGTKRLELTVSGLFILYFQLEMVVKNMFLFKFSYSKGSVLVDYFVELTDLPEDLNTLQIKRMFHEALMESPSEFQSVVPLSSSADSENDENVTRKNQVTLGRFAIDPVSTDFIGK